MLPESKQILEADVLLHEVKSLECCCASAAVPLLSGDVRESEDRLPIPNVSNSVSSLASSHGVPTKTVYMSHDLLSMVFNA